MHEESTTPDDPTLRALQIFVRPHTVDLEPNIQFKEIGTPPLNEWRLLAGPEDTEAPSFIRNYRGRIDVNGTSLETKEGLLLVNETEVWVRALEDAIAVAFLINPKARVTHAGTIGL